MADAQTGLRARYQGFCEVEKLEPAVLDALLRDGDPPERVWAIWALALLKGDAVLSELRPLLGEDPSSGVRRHLLNVFAGHGDLDVVAHVACWDQAAWVRQAALLYLCRVAVRQGEAVWRLLADRLVSEASRPVVCALIEALPESPPAFVAGRLEVLADSEHAGVGAAARRRLGWTVEEATREPSLARAQQEEEDWRRYLPVPWRPPLPARPLNLFR